mgnify:CR=1 FL=1
MNPNELQKLKDRAPLPVFILLILLFLPSILIEPELTALDTAADSYQNQVKAASVAVKTHQNNGRNNLKLQQLKSIREDLMRILPDEADLPDLIDRLQKLAGECDVLLQEVRYDFSREFEKLSVPSYQLHMNLNAEYASMRKFLAAVESLNSPVIINEIVLIEGKRYALTMRLPVK